MALRSAQARAIRRRLVVRLVAGLAIYVAVFSLVMFLVVQLVVPQVREYVVDSTAPWEYHSVEEYEGIAETLARSDRYQVIPQYTNADGEWVAAPSGDDAQWVQLVGYAVRDMGVYNVLTRLAAPAAVLVFAAGALSVVIVVLNRSIRYFDELSSAVTGLLTDRAAAVVLSDDLSIAREELADIQRKTLADERAAALAEQRKNELVAYLAHDIRTPLTSVLGYVALLKESPDLPLEARARYAGLAYEKAERLEGLIGEFFEITRYNLQSIPIERERVGIALFCEQLADEFFPECEAKGVKMQVDAPAGALFFVDPGKLARALSNVLRNAVAYAEEGSTVRFDAQAKDGRVVMTVQNQGREISPAHLNAIFEKFFREDGSRSTDKGGAGLGLAIAKEIVVAHGGTIEAASENGTTTFTVTVPQ